MTIRTKRLAPGDESTLSMIAIQEADFDMQGESGPAAPLSATDARAYLANSAVLFWVSLDENDCVTGFVSCVLVPLRAAPGRELLLYDIGVRKAWRRRGAGRALLTQMNCWMQDNAVELCWVLSDQSAVQFYRACGFHADDDQPVFMLREI